MICLAHGSSADALAGEQTNIRRRLAVLPGPFASNGPDILTVLMCGRPAPCRPDLFASSTPRFFPLTAEDKAALRARW